MSAAEPRRYLTHDCDQGRVELVVQLGANGDWYVSVVPEGHRLSWLDDASMGRRQRATVRVTTSGERSGQIGAANAVADLYRAMGGEVAAELDEQTMRHIAGDTRAREAERDAWKALAQANDKIIDGLVCSGGPMTGDGCDAANIARGKLRALSIGPDAT